MRQPHVHPEEPPRSLARVLLMVAALVPWIVLFLFVLPGLAS
jgi:hypothetical protein